MGNVLSSVLQELAANQQPSLLKHPFNSEVVFSFKVRMDHLCFVPGWRICSIVMAAPARRSTATW